MSPYEPDSDAYDSGKVLQAATVWSTQRGGSDVEGSGKEGMDLIIYHLTLAAARKFGGLVEYLNGVFNAELELGRTYPQEKPMNRDSFERYFFSADVFVAFRRSMDQTGEAVAFEEAVNGRSWDECIAGFYYVKSNYPGRSSHICNAGFVTVPSLRGKGVGRVLARSFVHYAPRLGYTASVFNLVYETNVPSLRLWEALGFTKVGKIPAAGRLRKLGGTGEAEQEEEEHVDAWIIYKHF